MSSGSRAKQQILRLDTNVWSIKEKKKDKLDFIKI